MPECGDCDETFDKDELICADSAEKVDECTLEGCVNGCKEVYCEACFDED